MALAGVVQVRQPVAEPGPEVQQRGRGLVGHPPVAVGRARGDAFEQREHAAHLGHRVQRRDEVHLRRAGVGEAHVDTRVDQRAQQSLGAVQSKIAPGLRMPAGSKAVLMRRNSATFAGSSSAR